MIQSKIIQGKIVDIPNQRIFNGELKIIEGRIVSIQEKKHDNDQFILPGFIDAHGHVASLGQEMLRVKLRDIGSEAMAVNAVKTFAMENPGAQWILGRGWNQVLWPNQKFPSKSTLDATNGAE